MRALCIILLIFWCCTAHAQKLLIDSTVFDKWPDARTALLSDDGRYYVSSVSYPDRGTEYSIVSIDGRWGKKYWDLKSVILIKNGRSIVFQTSGDSLCILQLGSKHPQYIARSTSFRILRNARQEWLVWIAKEGRYSKLNIKDINTGESHIEDSLVNYWACKDQSSIVVKKLTEREVGTQYSYEWISLMDFSHHFIWKGNDIDNLTFGMRGSLQEIAFLGSEKVGLPSEWAMWYYKPGMPSAEQFAITSNTQTGLGLTISRSAGLQFSGDGRKLFFGLKDTSDRFPRPVKGVDVWSYRDPFLQEETLSKVAYEQSFTCSIDVDSKFVVQIENEEMLLRFGIFSLIGCNHYAVARKGDIDDYWWRDSSEPAIYLVSLDNGERRLLQKGKFFDERNRRWDVTAGWLLSDEEKYIIYGDPATRHFMSYEISTGEVRDITPGMFIGELDISGWLPADKYVIFHDKWDLWKIDPKGVEKPINLTNGYGKKRHLQFRPLLQPNQTHSLPANATVLLQAFDTANKYSGYYRMRMNKIADPDSLTMGPYRYRFVTKAPNANLSILMRESAAEAPNFFLTQDDMKVFKPMTFVEPQKKYNWLQAELVNWKLPNGHSCVGMLFKPENIDLSRKYPLLINYYLRQSNELYRFRDPDPSRDNINIPYFVSRGYIVFVPDIPDRDGKMGESALETVISGIRYLSRQSWMDTTRIGIEGQSFGGYLTNYLITHSHLFAAAAEMSGVSDMISAYSSIVDKGSTNQDIFEVGQYRMIVSPWQDQVIYLANSAVLRADQVTTPVLLTNNKNDPLVPWTQGVEFFTALRRNGKKAWLLQYDQSGHSLQGDDARDYTIRLEQFFDYYLKGTPPPRWMTEGIPARLKGVENRYELDRSGKIP